MSGFSVYVPKDRESLPEDLRKGSVIMNIGRVFRVTPRTSAHANFADACREATEQRGVPLDPKTIELVEVGFFDDYLGEVRLLPGRSKLLAGWIGHVPYRNDLEARDSLQNTRAQARQEFRRAWAQGRMDKAAQIANKHHLRGW